MVNLAILLGLVGLAGSLWTLYHSRKVHRWFKSHRHAKSWNPPASVIVPVRGMHDNLESNLKSLLNQDYPEYEVIFVLDSKSDEAYSAVKNAVQRKNARYARIAITKERKGYHGKIAALLTGIEKARYDVYAFADADGSARKQWLRHIVGPLEKKDVAAATSFRFYVPENFASYVRSAWNQFGIYLMKGMTRFVWGGSVGITKEMFRKLGVKGYWKNAISDDSQLSRAIRNSKYRLEFVPYCIMKSRGPVTWSSMMEFTKRQVLIVKTYFPHSAWVMPGFVYGHLMQILAAAYLVMFALTGRGLPEALLFMSGSVVMAVRNSLSYDFFSRMVRHRSSRAWFVLASMLAGWVMTYSYLHALFSKKITWRGRTFILKGPQNVVPGSG